MGTCDTATLRLSFWKNRLIQLVCFICLQYGCQMRETIHVSSTRSGNRSLTNKFSAHLFFIHPPPGVIERINSEQLRAGRRDTAALVNCVITEIYLNNTQRTVIKLLTRCGIELSTRPISNLVNNSIYFRHSESHKWLN